MRMGEVGILDEDDRVELIQGEIVIMAPLGSRHAGCVKRLNRIFGSRLGQRALIAVQDPLELDKYSQPQPDLMLLRPRPDDYVNAHPKPEEVLLLIEVADTTIRYEQEVKVPLYFQKGRARGVDR